MIDIGAQKTTSREIFSFEDSSEERGRVCDELPSLLTDNM